jgi:hypothetical protein
MLAIDQRWHRIKAFDGNVLTKVIRVANEIPDDKLIRIASPWKNVFIIRNVYAIVIILEISIRH